MVAHLDIAGAIVRLEGELPDRPLSLPPAYRAFLTDDTRRSIAGYVCLSPDTPRLPRIGSGPLLWESDIWRMGTDSDGRHIIEIHDVVDCRWVPVAVTAPDFREGTLQPFAGRRAAPSGYALNYPADQIILINLLLECGVIVLHAAAVIIEGRGAVFGGRADIGKTTLGRLCRARGATLINDDRCALFMRDGMPWVTATPWHGEEPEINVVEAPLAGVFHLSQQSQCRMTSLSPDLALARLLATGIAPFYRREGLEHALQLMAELLECTASYDFGVRPDSSAFVMLGETLRDTAPATP